MKNAYQAIAKQASLVGAQDTEADQFQLVKQWLESVDSGNWIMIIDNADDEELFFGGDEDRADGPSGLSDMLANYFPRRLNGSILLTTRNKKVGVKFAGIHDLITIPKMSVSESKNLLVKNLEEENHDDDNLTELVDTLENLPLALVQAAAFIGENSLSVAEYLQMCRGSDSSKINLLSQKFEDNERDPAIKNPVAVTFAISFEQIRKNDRRAAELLSLMSVLDRQTVPKQLLSSITDEVELEKALGTLKAFSLITPEQSSQAFSMHRLVYLATRNWLNMNEELRSWTGKALVLLSELFPKAMDENWKIWMAYLPHAHTVLSSDHLLASEYISQAMLLFKICGALHYKDDYYLTEILDPSSLDMREKPLGKNDCATFCSCNFIDLTLYIQAEDAKAMEIQRNVLNDVEEMVGEERLRTLTGLNELGLLLGGQTQIQYDEVEKLHRRALTISDKVLRKEYSATLCNVRKLRLTFGTSMLTTP